MTGRTLQEAVMMMIPEAWQKRETHGGEQARVLRISLVLMEPWDGPASIAFTDGRYIGAVLDRNGLRPSRYYLTHDDRVIMASEVGVLADRSEARQAEGPPQPGRMFLVDFEQGRMIPDAELKDEFADRLPYAEWLANQRIQLRRPVAELSESHGFDADTLLKRMQAFGYTSRRCSSCCFRWCANCAIRSVPWATIRRWPVCPTSRA